MKHCLHAVMSIVVLSGCAVVETKPLKADQASAGGVVYYLPTRPIKVEVVRAVAATKPEVEKATAAVKAATEAQEKAKKTLEELTARKDATAAGTAARTEAEKAVQFAAADLVLADAELASTKKKLADAQADHIQTLNGRPPLVDTITVSLLPAVADTSKRYSANLKHYVTRSDKFEIKTTAAGLLSTSNARSEDQSGAILVSLAQSIAAVGASGPGAGSSIIDLQAFSLKKDLPLKPNGDAARAESRINCGNGISRLGNADRAPFKFEHIFDPTDSEVEQTIARNGVPKAETVNPWKYVESALCGVGADYKFQWQALAQQLTADAPSAMKATRSAWSGLIYRRSLPYRLTVYKGSRQIADVGNDADSAWASFTPLKDFHFEVPNDSPPELLNIEGGLFSARDYGTEFVEGMLVSHKEERPSEALEVVSIPYKVLKALIAVPAEILSLKVDYSSKEAALLDAQTKVILSNDALEEARANAAATPPTESGAP